MMRITLFLAALLPAALALNIPLQDQAANGLKDNSESTYNQQLDCYDQPNCYGTRITIGSSPVPDLANAPYYFDNRIVSCMYNGIYNLYDGWYYNQDNLNGGVYAEAYGDNNCVNMDGFAYKATSIRMIGPSSNWRYDSINFFEGQYYNGQMQYFYSNANSFQYDNFGQSMIITGCSPWTLYEFSNFQGQSACWYPADTQNCIPGFFRDPSMMKGWANQVSSVQHGCYSDTKYYGELLPQMDTENGTSIEASMGGYIHN